MQHIYFIECKLYCLGQYISQIRLLATCPQGKVESLTPLNLHRQAKLKYWCEIQFICDWTLFGPAAVEKACVAVALEPGCL